MTLDNIPSVKIITRTWGLLVLCDSATLSSFLSLRLHGLLLVILHVIRTSSAIVNLVSCSEQQTKVSYSFGPPYTNTTNAPFTNDARKQTQLLRSGTKPRDVGINESLVFLALTLASQ